MSHIRVTAGHPLLEGYVKSPPAGLCELIWNAFDEDAQTVRVEIENSTLGALDTISVSDDGNGMNRERAELAFSRVGDSWKRMPGTTSDDGRPVHGRHGRGRYTAFSLGSAVRWKSTSKVTDGSELAAIAVKGSRSSLDEFDIIDLDNPQTHSGTEVVVTGISIEAQKAFDSLESLKQKVLTEFALHLDRHENFKIWFLGERLDPKHVIKKRVTHELALPSDIDGPAHLTVIEWKLVNVDRRIYLCSPGGAIVDETSAKIQSIGSEFTAYLEWQGFDHSDGIMADLDEESAAAKVIGVARETLREHLAQSARRREAETVSKWRAEGVYPYKNEPKTAVERASRDTFNVVALAAARTVDESKSRTSKAMALSLLKETFESDPEALLPILKQFSQLPASRIEELRVILERSSLSQLISLGREVGSRVEFLHGINALVFDKLSKKKLLERRQLHRILAHETWLFGEEWSITGDDKRLTEVLKNYLGKLGLDVELANGPALLREDGSDGIPDLVLGRQLETRENFFSHLVIELKRPSHKLTDDDVSQLRSYASAITNDERFDQPNSAWEFWLIGNETTGAVDEQRHQETLPAGVVQHSKKYKLIVRTWAEIVGDAEHRLKFVQKSLQYESNRDTGLQTLREKYAEYLPEEVLNEVSPADETADLDAAS
jgi:hypothetical protein